MTSTCKLISLFSGAVIEAGCEVIRMATGVVPVPEEPPPEEPAGGVIVDGGRTIIAAEPPPLEPPELPPEDPPRLSLGVEIVPPRELLEPLLPWAGVTVPVRPLGAEDVGVFVFEVLEASSFSSGALQFGKSNRVAVSPKDCKILRQHIDFVTIVNPHHFIG